LTDVGLYVFAMQVSLLHLADITEEGVTFQSPVDGKPMLLTPEESIQIQVIPFKYLLKVYEGIVLVVSCTPRLV